MALWNDLAAVLFPRTCPACGKRLTAAEGEVCLDCLLDIASTHFEKRPTDNELYYRLAGRVAIAGAVPLLYFEKSGKVKQLISALKYRNRPQLGVFLGHYLGEQLRGQPWMADVSAIVPVPLHTRRMATRGYNQSAQLGSGLSQALGIPQHPHALTRIVNTRTQTRKGQAERWQNVKEAFQLATPLKGHVLLVDDVVTTGTTTEACVRALLDCAEPPKVTVLAAAMTRR